MPPQQPGLGKNRFSADSHVEKPRVHLPGWKHRFDRCGPHRLIVGAWVLSTHPVPGFRVTSCFDSSPANGMARKTSSCNPTPLSSTSTFSCRAWPIPVCCVRFNDFRFGSAAWGSGSFWLGACVRPRILRFGEDLGRSCTRKAGNTVRYISLDRLADFLRRRVHRLDPWGHPLARRGEFVAWVYVCANCNPVLDTSAVGLLSRRKSRWVHPGDVSSIT